LKISKKLYYLKKTLILFIVLSIIPFLFSCTGTNSILKDDSGTFRGKYWNYYDRGIASAEKEDWESAIQAMQQAIFMRSKDQRMARTYGMHFIDYFPHRELGILYFQKGDIEGAIAELAESIRNEESAKAYFYLNKVRKVSLLKQTGKQMKPPLIAITSPVEGNVFNSFTIKVKGSVTGDGFISKIFVNGSPYRIDLAREEIDFEQDIEVDDGENNIVITSQDLLGNIAEQTVTVRIDREGPVINISDISQEEIKGEKHIRVTGEIIDNSGIRKLLMDGKEIKVKDPKTYALELVIDNKHVDEKLFIQAFDSLDNETTAEIDLKKDVIAFNRKPDTVHLAFNSNKIFSFDKEPPTISLKDTGNILVVFVDKYFIEGEAFDNSKIERIFVNNKEISIKKGKKIFFSKVVKLREGENRIEVVAYDSSNNKAVSGFSLRRDIPMVKQVVSRMSVSVLPFESKQGGAGTISQLAYEQLISSFVEQKRFSVIERAKLEQVLLEQKLTKAALTDPEHSIKVGRLMSAESILVTSIKEDPKSVEIISRLINTETSELMEVKDVYCEDKSLSSVKELMDGLAIKIATSFPVVEGMVIKKDSGYLYTDIGSVMKIKKDMGVIFYRKGKEITHPITGKFLGNDITKLGEGRIEEIQENFSKVKLAEKFRQQDIHVKDMMITK
jgi:tetratricopeptide (TPR) repeat protein